MRGETAPMGSAHPYFMENMEEAVRLDRKTDPAEVRRQAAWCGLKPGLRVLDAGCGPGRISAILNEMVQAGGSVLGVDYSEDRIRYAREHYGGGDTVRFRTHDLRTPLKDEGPFDLIWVRFVLEYNFEEGPDIVRHLTDSLRPGGTLCLMDLDHNCLSHYELPPGMEEIFLQLARRAQKEYNFDAYAGRRLYAHLYDLGYEEVRMDLLPHHLFYGEVKDRDIFNWVKKADVVSDRARGMFDRYPGGHTAFFEDFKRFFLNPRRFTYTPLILCKGIKPEA